jgi:hypothetical protein
MRAHNFSLFVVAKKNASAGRDSPSEPAVLRGGVVSATADRAEFFTANFSSGTAKNFSPGRAFA